VIGQLGNWVIRKLEYWYLGNQVIRDSGDEGDRLNTCY
jgi:hypothetical protein